MMSKKAKRGEREDDKDKSVTFVMKWKSSTKTTENVTTLQSLTINDSTTHLITRGTFSSSMRLQTISIPNSVHCIGEGAFEYCNSLTSIIVPDSVTYIGESAFNGCRSLRTFVIPESVFAIRSCAFENCTSLQSIIIPDAVTYIEDNAFAYCSSLKSIALPSSLMYFGRSVFDSCHALEKRDIHGINYNFSVEIWLRNRFENLPLHKACYLDTKNLTFEDFTSLIEEYKHTLNVADSMGMTPFHILSCNPTASAEMIKTLKICSVQDIKDSLNKSPVMNFLSCRSILNHDAHYFKAVKDGPSLNKLLTLGLQLDDLEKLLAYDDEAFLVNEMERHDEETGLNPVMTAASLPYIGLDLVYTLIMKYPGSLDCNKMITKY